MNSETLLHRMVHPTWLQNGLPTSQTFRPTPKDAGRLSVYDGSQISARDAWLHFIGVSPGERPPVGVVAVSVEECLHSGLPVVPDPATFPGHTLIDFTGLSKNQIKRKAGGLKDAANTRGWQFRPAIV